MEVSISIVLAVLTGLVIIYYFVFRENYFDKYGIPHLKPSAIFGNMAPIIFQRDTFVGHVTSIYNVHKDAKYVGLHDFSMPVIMIKDLELIKSITVKHFDNFIDRRGVVDPEIDSLFGKNLLTLRGDRWRESRILLSPAFTSSKMKAMFKLMSECANAFSDTLVKQARNRANGINSKDIFTRYTNDAIASCLFGVAVDSMNNPDNDFYTLGRRAANFEGIRSLKFFMIRAFPSMSKLLRIKLIGTKIENFFYDLVRDTIATRDAQGINRPDIIQLMMETRGHKPGSKNPELSIESMTSQVWGFYFGGFESTATSICFMAHEIASNPDVQKKLQEEIDQVLEKDNGNLNYESINGMHYLDAVVSEILRLYPIAGFLSRVCTKSFELPPTLPGSKPLIVNPGTDLWIPLWSIHRDPQHFPNPDKFDPERFMGEAKDTINHSAYLPFGVGPRMCMGNRFALMEIKVLFFHLLAKCNITLSKKMILPMRLSKKNFMLTADGGFWLDIQPRK
uniref:Cytochrome P450 n=1 Tax=Glyptapanteles indiensis TaxID=92994 RepID=B7S8W8_GLYIN|nr:cytochrome P450 [Glyptapanteles indiensis]